MFFSWYTRGPQPNLHILVEARLHCTMFLKAEPWVQVSFASLLGIASCPCLKLALTLRLNLGVGGVTPHRKLGRTTTEVRKCHV